MGPAKPRIAYDQLALVMRRTRPWAWRLGFALAVFAIAVAVRHALDPVLGGGVPYILFFPAIFVTAVFAAALPAVAVMAAGAIYAWAFFMGDGTTVAQKSVATFTYLAVGGAFIVLVELLRGALGSVMRAEAEALRMAEARDLMFHELQHRVFNNLQMIASTLNLQRGAMRDPAAREVLDGAVLRIRTVAKVQRKLGKASHGSLDFAELIGESLHEAAEVSQGAFGRRVSLTVLGHGPEIAGDMAILLSLVVTELVSNAVEHGGGGAGEGIVVRVTCGMSPDGLGLVEVRDCGPGLPDGFDATDAPGTGLRLARLFVEQVGGSISFASDGGTVAKVVFPLSRPVAEARNEAVFQHRATAAGAS
jgi:two-component system, sensor histidine kinase PdtaS